MRVASTEHAPGGRPVVALVLLAAFLCMAGAAAGQAIDNQLWETNGKVYAALVSGNTLYIGGTFTYVGPHTGRGVPLDAATGAVAGPFPEASGGAVDAVLPDGAGGWYVGGGFTRAGGAPRAGLAHVLSDGSVAAWNPGADGPVHALAIAGGTLYVGGDFAHAGGQARGRLAAFDLTTGLLTAWDPGADGAVIALAASGNTVYAGGWFANAGGQPRSRIASIDAATGLTTAWDPAADNTVYALAISGGAVYAGGDFASIGGQPRSRIAALDAATGSATGWNPAANGTVHALVPSGAVLYATGSFSTIGGASRNRIAALDLVSGSATAWAPTALAGTEPRALTVSGSTVYAGGFQFFWDYGSTNAFVRAMDAGTGATLAFSAPANDSVFALAASGDRVYAGGSFTSVGGVGRSYIAALDRSTGQVTSWSPGLAPTWLGAVYALQSAGNLVYAGGAFEMGTFGQASYRRNLVALDMSTGLPTTWNPKPGGLDPAVYALALSSNVIYAGGGFTSCGGSGRSCIAAVDLSTGLATSWYPTGGTQEVDALALSGNTLYVGGQFTTIGGLNRNRLAAVDAATAAVTAWDPAMSFAGYLPFVSALATSGNVVYVGGGFSIIGGQPRSRLGAVDAATGLATNWDPNPDSNVDCLLPVGSLVYAGGMFTSVGGVSGSALASLDAPTGLATAWAPGVISVPNFTYPRMLDVRALAATDYTVYVGGDFKSVCGQDRYYLAGISVDLPTPTLVSLMSARAETGRVRLSWLAADRVTSATLYRRTAASGWESIAALSANGEGVLAYDDTQIRAGTRYGYRLGLVSGGQELFLGETWVDVPALALALSGLMPNPTLRGLTVAFALPDALPARLTVLDVAGRTVAGLEVGSLGAGAHTVDLAGGRALPPGMYLIRLTQGARTLTARGVVIR
jgi:hypothetical protein